MDFEKLKEYFLQYVDDNNLKADEIIKTADELSDVAIRVLSEKDPYVYVFKRGRFLQKFNKEKIQFSIENAGKDAGVQLSTSDLNLIIDEAISPYEGDQLIYASDLRENIDKALRNNGFKSVAREYIKY